MKLLRETMRNIWEVINTLIDPFERINQEVIDCVVRGGTHEMGCTQSEFKRFMEEDFIRLFKSGYFGNLKMFEAVQIYVLQIGREVL